MKKNTMCLNPILIKNVNYGYHANSLRGSGLANYKDTESQYIAVPCNNCPVCIALRQNYFVQRVQMESFDSAIFFFTLTYNNETLPSVNVAGRKITYWDISHIQNMFKRIRKHGLLPPFKYVVALERGTKRHRPHFHGLLFIPFKYFCRFPDNPSRGECNSMALDVQDALLKEWTHNVGSRKFPVYIPNFTDIKRGNFRNFDCSFVDTLKQDAEDVSFYVSKYLLKYDEYSNKLKQWIYVNDPDNFKQLWSLVKPKILYSKGFGNKKSKLVQNFIEDCLYLSIGSTSVYPCYFSPHNGKSFPLSRYYYSLIPAHIQEIFLKRQKDATGTLSDKSNVTASILDFDYTVEDIQRKLSDFDKIKKFVRGEQYDEIGDLLADL